MNSRVIVHMDLDCFYAQVEGNRLNIPSTEPLAVQQWGALIAVNYAAREFDISRRDNVTTAKKKCPGIHLPHVGTRGAKKENEESNTELNRNTQKADLGRYRRASSDILKLIMQHVPFCQRASIDEVYLDVTEQVRERLNGHPTRRYRHLTKDTKIIGDPSEPEDLDDAYLHLGGLIASEIRQDIREKLNYTISAGIAHNKFLAKMATSVNKPDGQTMIRNCGARVFVAEHPIDKIHALKGKLGQQVQQILKVKTAGEIQCYDKQAFRLALGLNDETCTFIYRRCLGEDDEPVKIDNAAKSMTSAKNFPKPGCSTKEKLNYWIELLSHDLVDRVQEERGLNDRVASKLILHYITSTTKTKTITYPRKNTPEIVEKAVRDTLFGMHEPVLPCFHLSLSAKDFHDIAIGPNDQAITTFFSKSDDKPLIPLALRKPADDGLRRVNVSRKGIDSFFKTSGRKHNEVFEVGGDASSGEWTCPRCQDRMSENLMQEHQDYHYARDLQRDFSCTQPSKKQKTKKSRDKPQLSIRDYFTTS